MKYQYLFFDLDGTLTDSGLGIMKSVRYALEKMGKEIPGEDVLRRFIGPPLIYSFQHFCGMSEAEAEIGVRTYREYFSVTGLFENKVYDGVVDMLEQLKAAGNKLVVATSKPEIYSVRIMEHFHLDCYFECIAGSSLDESRNTKEAVIRYAMEKNGITQPQDVLMIGDREHDVFGAAACQIQCLGVLWGYGSEEELRKAGAVDIVAEPKEVPLYCQS